MINGISGHTDLLPHQPSSNALMELAQIIAEITSPSRGLLLYNSDTLLQHINTLVAETTGTLHTWSREYTPDMQAMLTSRCSMVSRLVPLVKSSPQMQNYPEAVTQAIADGLEHLCLELHRHLYQFFQADYQLPASYIKMEAHHASIQYRRLLADYPDNPLIKAMLRPAHKLICQTAGNNTKERIDYINLLIGNIKLWHRKKGTQEQLYEIALTMNLKCPRLLQHMATEAGNRILKCNKKAERLECIEHLRKQHRHALASRQWKSSPHGFYLPHASAVSVYINDWLNEQTELVNDEMQSSAEDTQPSEEEIIRSEMKEDAPFFSVLIRVMVTAGLTKIKKFAPALHSFGRIVSFLRAKAPSSTYLIMLASSRIPGTLLDKLEAYFEECLLIVRKVRRNDGKFPDDTEKADKA